MAPESKVLPDSESPPDAENEKVDIGKVTAIIAAFLMALGMVATATWAISTKQYVQQVRADNYRQETNTKRIDSHEDWIMSFNTALGALPAMAEDISEIKTDVRALETRGR